MRFCGSCYQRASTQLSPVPRIDWGLRDYQLPPLVWGGDDPDCEHEWGDEIVAKSKDSNRGDMEWTTGGAPGAKVLGKHPSQGSFCLHCNAWRGALGLEPAPDLYVAHLVEVMREVHRVLRDDGTCWVNLGDSYASTPQVDSHADPKAPRRVPGGRCRTNTLKPKDLVGIPWRVAFAFQADGWWLRSDIIWNKPNCMPESVTDRPTRAHEYVFLLSKSARYFYDADAIRERTGNEMARDEYAALCASVSKSRGNLVEGKNAADLNKRGGISHPAGRNKRTVWTVPTFPFTGWTETSRLVRVALDDVSDGMTRIASPGCPVHDCLDCLCDEREGDDQSHKPDTPHRPEQSQPPLLAGDSMPLESLHLVGDTDSQGQSCSSSATDHSTQSHKTGHVPATNQPCTPCVETPAHTGDRPALPVSAGLHANMPGCNTWPDEMDARSLDQTLHHTVDKSSLPVPPECLCGFYHRITEKSSHFATFPPALVEPMVRAGTSERGVCPECGAGWVRVVEPTGHVNKREPAHAPNNDPTKTDSTGWAPTTKATNRWHPTCDHYRTRNKRRRRQQDALWEIVAVAVTIADDKKASEADRAWANDIIQRFGRYTWDWRACKSKAAPTVPAVVLDNHAGSGTVGLVADRLGRDAILMDLSSDYCEMARERIEGDAPLFANVSTKLDTDR